MSVHSTLGHGGPSFSDGLPAAVRARSILLSTHELLVDELISGALSPAPTSPPELSPSVVHYGFIAVDAVPYLVSVGGEDLRPGPVVAVATGLDEELGELHLVGELGEWIYPSSNLRVAEVLEEHLECMIEPARDSIELLGLRVAPIRLTTVWTGAPGSTAPLAVDLDSFHVAAPDQWAAFAHQAIRHLNEQHHDELLWLARGAGAGGATAVSLTRLDATGAILTAMGLEGVMDVVIPFDPPADSPAEACRRLAGH